MFTIAETEGYYAAFKKSYAGPLEVYVDGSFNGSYGQMKRRVPVAAGWAIADKNKELVGYGVSTFKAKFTPSSEKNELRSMVAFLDAMQESFPERINRDFPVTLICDNKSLVVALTQASEHEKISRRFHGRHGDDYLSLLYYISVMDLDFKWVKGHNSNRFNCLADTMARKAFRAVTSDGSFPIKARRHYLLNALDAFGSYTGQKITSNQLRNTVSRQGHAILAEVPTLWVGVRKVEHKGRTFAGFSFTDTALGFKGSRGGVFLNQYNDLYLAVRAVNYALSEHAKHGPTESSLLIRVDNAEAAALVNTIGRDRKWNIALKNVGLRHEVEKLKVLMKSQHVISLSNSDFSKAYKKYSMMKESQIHAAETAYKAVADLIQAAA